MCLTTGFKITDLVSEFGFDEKNIDKLLQQWHNINYIQWKAISNVIEFQSEVRSYKNAAEINTFIELSDLAISVLSLPYSNAAVERTSKSAMNIGKNKL